jgi:DNA processing protein
MTPASPTMDADEIGAWLRLLQTPGVGRETARRLLAVYGSPAAVFAASPADRRSVVPAVVANSLAVVPDGVDAQVAVTLAWLGTKTTPGPRALIAIGDPRYPVCLLESADPPLLLYAQGQIDCLDGDIVAVVGSRNPTPQGVENARAFAHGLGAAGYAVVSGLALGIDTAAHEGALAGGGGTIAVVGTGLDRVYPSRNRALTHRIAEHGLLLSEYALGTPPLPSHFPPRNRIIAGLAQGTLVVEAALQSGSLITARLASENGREVFAIPGSIHAPQSRGCHALIQQGAKLVEKVDDVLDELRPQRSPARSSATVPPPLGNADPGDALLAALGHDPVTLDDLVARTGAAAAELSVRLFDLELGGTVARLPGQRFQRLFAGDAVREG